MLYASNVVLFALCGIFGRFDFPGCRAILQRCGPDLSRHPVSTGMPRASLTITAAHVNVTVQSASHSGPTNIKVCLKPGTICPVTGNSEGSFGIFYSPVPVQYCYWTVAVPTVTFGSERSMLTMGESAEKYISIAPESIMPVACG